MLDACIFAYRVTMSNRINETPFFLVYGRDPTLPGDLIINNGTPNKKKDKSNKKNESKEDDLRKNR